MMRIRRAYRAFARLAPIGLIDHSPVVLEHVVPLFGLWHLPVAFLALGMLTIPYLVFVHTTIGYFLVTSWRRTGNLAAPGIAHAVIDVLRNGVAVL